jgi:transcription initiation factor TFIIA large subunit
MDVIEGVIRESRPDFEDAGVDDQTLQDLRQIWQTKLSELGIARLPWDFQEPAPAVPSGPAGAGSYYDGVIPVKSEEESYSGIPQSQAAAYRAAQNVHDYADNRGIVSSQQSVQGIMRRGLDLPPVTASATPNASTATAGAAADSSTNNQGNGLPSGGLVLPGGSHIPQTDGARGDLPTLRNSPSGLVLPGRPSHLPQTDGANDLPLSTEQIDKIIDEKLRKMREAGETLNSRGGKLEITLSLDRLRRLQTDGAADGDVDDNDDINSDLDDPEEELNSDNENDEEDQSMLMLCLYDKVQRVKSKWKYVLKDGVARINGKDYVFSRSTGESEW